MSGTRVVCHLRMFMNQFSNFYFMIDVLINIFI